MPTLQQKKAAKIVSEIIRNEADARTLGQALLEAGYNKSVSESPQLVTESKGYLEAFEELMPDTALAKKHDQLLNKTQLEHMVFPLAVTDNEITELVESIGSTVKKFKHGDTATHVWFWSMDGKATKDALDMAYKLKGSYAAQKVSTVNLNLNADVKMDKKTVALRDEYEEKLFDQMLDG